MTAKTIIWVASLLNSVSGTVVAADAPTLPFQKASVVVPLLKEVKPGDGLDKLQRILGQALVPSVGGAGQMQWSCPLDDGSVVCVSTWDMPSRHGIASLGLREVNGKMHTLYSQQTK